jgi:phage gpG-like protein
MAHLRLVRTKQTGQVEALVGSVAKEAAIHRIGTSHRAVRASVNIYG